MRLHSSCAYRLDQQVSEKLLVPICALPLVKRRNVALKAEGLA